MTSDRIERIEAAIAEAEAQGLGWTNDSIHRITGGSYSNLSSYLRDRRAQAALDAEAGAVAVEEPPAPSPPQTPLHRARSARDQTAEAEHALGVEEQTIRQQRQALEQAALRLRIQQNGTGQSDARDEAARRQLEDIRRDLAEAETQRLAVHLRRREAHVQVLEAAEAYDALHGQAARWLRRLRAAQRQRQAGQTAGQRGDAREEFEQALGELARRWARLRRRTWPTTPAPNLTGCGAEAMRRTPLLWLACASKSGAHPGRWRSARGRV